MGVEDVAIGNAGEVLPVLLWPLFVFAFARLAAEAIILAVEGHDEGSLSRAVELAVLA